MKNYILLLITLLPLVSFAQKKVAVVSAYSFYMEEGGDLNELGEFISKEGILKEVYEGKFAELKNKIGEFLTLTDDDHLNQDFYKYVLDEYEPSPNSFDYTPGAVYLPGDDKPKLDYRISEKLVFAVGDYLAIGNFKPFKNDEAIQTIYEKIPDASGQMFFQFFPSASFSGTGGFGQGEAAAFITLRYEVINKKLKAVLKSGLLGVAGKSTLKIPIGDGEFDRETVKKAYEEAMDAIISKIEGKIKKKASKIKL